MPASGRTLDYAQLPRWYRRRIWRRGLAVGLLFLLALVGLWYRQLILGFARLHYYESRCLTYELPETQAAFEIDPEKGNKLLKLSPDYCTTPYSVYLFPSSLAAYDPTQVPGWGAVIFLHERTSPAGKRRLVGVFLGTLGVGQYTDEGQVIALVVSYQSYPILHLWDRARPNHVAADAGRLAVTRNLGEGTGQASFDSRVFFGQCNSSDASRFTINYVMGGERDVIDGQLLDDGTLKLKPRRARILNNNNLNMADEMVWDLLPRGPSAVTSPHPKGAAGNPGP
jgi:hypothetical protein